MRAWRSARRPLHGDRSASHTLVTDLKPDDVMRPVEIRRGDITVHNEGVLHGSGGNTSKSSYRRAYIVALRSESTVAEERRRGFTHSHNDAGEVLDGVDGLRTLCDALGIEHDPEFERWFSANVTSDAMHGGRWRRDLKRRTADELDRRYAKWCAVLSERYPQFSLPRSS